MMKSKFPYYYGADEVSQQNAKDLRKICTPAEDRFWKFVQNRNLFNLKFRRQHPVGDFTVDFYCHELRLVVELDGNVHDSDKVQKRDKWRERKIKEKGLRILRFKNEDVFLNPHLIEIELKKLLRLSNEKL